MKNAWKYLMGSLLGLLGFGGCDIGSGLEMYGTPTAEFKLIGDVKDSENHPVQGIRVVMTPHPFDGRNDTLYTDAKGHFEGDYLRYIDMGELRDGTLYFDDVDGEANGSFLPCVVKREGLEVTQTRKGSGMWDNGSYTVRADAILEKEKP